MKKKHLIAAATALGLVAAVPASAKVDVIQSSSTALARGSSFAWAPMPAIGYGVPDPTIANEVTADRLRAITEVTLANKGYHQVADPSAADLLVAYTIIIVPESGHAKDGSPQATGHIQGTLVLDLIERRTGRLVLRATSERHVTGKDVSQEKLVALLRKMTSSLPQQ